MCTCFKRRWCNKTHTSYVHECGCLITAVACTESHFQTSRALRRCGRWIRCRNTGGGPWNVTPTWVSGMRHLSPPPTSDMEYVQMSEREAIVLCRDKVVPFSKRSSRLAVEVEFETGTLSCFRGCRIIAQVLQLVCVKHQHCFLHPPF